MTEQNTFYSKAEDLSDMGHAIAAADCCVIREPRFTSETDIQGDFGINDFEEFRPDYQLPKNHNHIMVKVNQAYEQEGLIKNVIDLMSDFTVCGIRVEHPSKSIDKFYKKWFENAKGPDRSERFCHNLYKFGTSIITRGSREYSSRKGNVFLPDGYTFLNPAAVVDIDGIASINAGKPVDYGIYKPKRSRFIFNSLNIDKDDIEPLNAETTEVYHYKKDDWQVWSKPIIYSILREVFQLMMLRLADFTALEGAANPIRIFTLGSLDHQIVPGPAAMEKLSELLKVNNGHGTRNIVWTSDINLIESKTDNLAILGDEKYRPALSAIYVGLGIPPTLTGSSSIASRGTTNNLISLKTLIKRLQYGRQKLIEFWTKEIKIVQEKMGFRNPAKIAFDVINIGDEETEKKLWIELADRNIISDEWVRHKFGADPEIEQVKINREYEDRRKFKNAPKGGPWHDPQVIERYEKLLLEQGKVTPSQVGVVFPEPQGDEHFLDIQDSDNSNENDNTNQAQTKGRPKNAKDAQPRKRRRFVPQTKASIWAKGAQSHISNIINKVGLQHFGKSNLRKLSVEEFATLEKMKFNVLLNTQPMSQISEASVKDGVYPFNEKYYSLYSDAVRQIEYSTGSELTVDQKRFLQLEMYLDVIHNRI